MKFNVFWSVLSAVLGALIALYLTDQISETESAAKTSMNTHLDYTNALKPITTGAAAGESLPIQQQPEVDDRNFSAEELINISVYEKASKSVCNIDTITHGRFRMMLNAPPIEGSGSGWVLDKQGHVVTNHHVIDGSDAITVTLFAGEPFQAEVVGSDPQNDLAVLRINAPPEMLFPVEIGDSGALRVGQRVFAIGSPFGLERTMTVGIVSSLERAIKSPRTQRMIKKIIQVDAALNQGNSGGPLLDSSGKLVGMNTAIASATGENTGVGFAIPVDTIARFVPQLIRFGEVRRASLGIEIFWRADRGLGVVYVVDGGPAAKAGIRGAKLDRKIVRTRRGLEEAIEVDQSSADIILAIDGVVISSTDELQDLLDQLEPGRTVRLTIVREGVQQDLPLTLGRE